MLNSRRKSRVCRTVRVPAAAGALAFGLLAATACAAAALLCTLAAALPGMTVGPNGALGELDGLER